MLCRQTAQGSGCGLSVIQLVSLGIIIAFLQILQAHENNYAWCQVIGGNYIGKSVQRQSVKNAVVKLAYTGSQVL